MIVFAFAGKGLSLYFAKLIMIGISEEVKKELQSNLFSSLIKADTKKIDGSHSGKFVTNLINDVNNITKKISKGSSIDQIFYLSFF